MRSRRRKGENMEYKFTTDNFEKEVLQASTPVLVDFYIEELLEVRKV